MDNPPRQLFEQKERSRQSALRQGESLWPFYDERVSAGYEEYRDALNSWIDELPATDASELISRFRSGNDQSYNAAMAELVIHSCLLAAGASIICHPSGIHRTRNPDFLVNDATGQNRFVVEVTTFNSSDRQIASDNILAEIYNAINNIEIPTTCCLNLEILARGDKTPPLSRLAGEISSWANTDTAICPPVADSIFNIFSAAGWQIRIELLSGFRERNEKKGAIGIYWPTDVRILISEDRIRASLDRKARRYGQFNLPYVIVVADCSGELTGGEENSRVLTDALLGDETLSVWYDDNRELAQRASRKANGFWGCPKMPKNQNVSAVVLLPRANVWEFRNSKWQPIAFMNPFSDAPLQDNFMQFATHSIEDGKLVKKTGKNLADILGLPNPWPPVDL